MNFEQRFISHSAAHVTLSPSSVAALTAAQNRRKTTSFRVSVSFSNVSSHPVAIADIKCTSYHNPTWSSKNSSDKLTVDFDSEGEPGNQGDQILICKKYKEGQQLKTENTYFVL